MSDSRVPLAEGVRLNNHTLHMERRNHAVITGVLDVRSFHENEIILKVESGLMIVCGEGLHIGKLVLEDGKLDVQGRVDSIVYETARKRAGMFPHWLKREK